MSKHEQTIEDVTTDQTAKPKRQVQESRYTLSLVNSSSNAVNSDNELYRSLNLIQKEYLERLLKGVSFILRMPVENGALSDEKILYAVKRIMHALAVVQSGREMSIIDVEMIGKDEINVIKTILMDSPCKRFCLDVEKTGKQVISSQLSELVSINTKHSGFDITVTLLNAVLSSNVSHDVNLSDDDNAKTFSSCSGSPENIEASLAKYKLQLCGDEITLLEAVKKLRSTLEGAKLYCPKTFANENVDVINGLLGVGLFTSATRFLLNQVCAYMIAWKTESAPGQKTSITASKIKRLFRSSFRRYQLNPCDKLRYQELSTRISDSAKELEPGEEVECLWNEEIASSFKALVSSQFQHICKTNKCAEFQGKWLKKFIGFLASKQQLWPKGTMTGEFLESKASELLKVLKTDPTEEKVSALSQPQKTLTNRELEKLRRYRDIDKPQNAARNDVFKDKLPKKCTQNAGNGNSYRSRAKMITAEPERHLPSTTNQSSGGTSLATSSTRSCRTSEFADTKLDGKRRNSRHKSDESISENRGSSLRKKRYSNESLYEQDRTSKRPKLKESYLIDEMTDYDKKLQSFHVWDPLVNVTETKFKEVFKTKEGAPKTETLKENTPCSSSMIKSDNECRPRQKSANDGESTQKDNTSECLVAQISSSDNTEEKTEKTECNNKIGDNTSLSTSDDKKSSVLRESFGDMTVVCEQVEEGSVSVVISIQGYIFEGVASSRDEAVENASCKALLLAPFILPHLCRK